MHPRLCNVRHSEFGGAVGPACWPSLVAAFFSSSFISAGVALNGVGGITPDLADLFEL